MTWNKVTDKLPIDRGDYLTRIVVPKDQGGGYHTNTRIIGYNPLVREWLCCNLIVTHWMPLPEPPEDGE